MMKYDIKDIPFSRKGSYFAISYSAHHKAIFIRDVHGGDESPSELFELVLENGRETDLLNEAFQKDYLLEVDETLFRLSLREDPSQYVAIIFPEEDQLRLKVVGLQLSLKAHKVRYDSFNQLSETDYEYISYKKETKYLIEMIGEQITVNAPWYRVGNSSIHFHIDGRKSTQELIMTNYQVVPKVKKQTVSFEKSYAQVRDDYQVWADQSLEVPEDYQRGRQLATYILWSSVVAPVGQLTRESVYMSKNWMQNIWSWDNCFNAMGIGASQPKLAFDQFQVFIDHQDSSGVYPDFINDKYVSYNCCKPPIHAWAYEQLMSVNPYFEAPSQLELIYDSLVAATNFWLTYRMSDLGLPYYTHGNDSGWDNASVFHQGLPVVAPDLAAYLIQQMDCLARWASRLGKADESQKWLQTADHLTERLVSVLHDGERFVARSSRTGAVIKETNSLLMCLPLVIGYRLPETVLSSLVQQITTEFEGEFGLSTEASSSPLYQVDGYWLGPIWAPETYIFFDAFKRIGEQEIAERLARKYCQLANENGMAENYNPETGAGNDDLSFTWTSSVFLLLGNYLKGLSDE